MLVAVFLMAIWGALGATAAWAQETASIRGTLSDATGSAIAGGTVQVKNTETGLARVLTTDEAGRYEAPELPVGAYEVTGEKAGFQPARAKLKLDVGQRAGVDLVLSVAELRQSIQVQETAITADVTTSETSGLVGERQVKDLPLNGRSYDQLLTLNPGVVNYTSQRAGGTGTSNSVIGNMFSAAGRRPQENLYLLNGVEYTSASEINSTPGGASGQLLGVDAVREFAVQTDSYGAEYGKRPGAQVSIVTASGTDALHGSVYEFLRNNAFDARNFFDFGSIPQFQRNEFGGSLGGPIKKDKSFFFLNYEGFRQNLDLSDVTLVPDSNPARSPGLGGSRAQHQGARTAVAGVQRPGAGRRSRRSFHQSEAAHQRGFRQRAIRSDVLGQGFAGRRVYARRQHWQFAHQQSHQLRLRHGTRTGGQPERDARVFDPADQPRHRGILARSVLFQQLGDRCGARERRGLDQLRGADRRDRGRRRHDA